MPQVNYPSRTPSRRSSGDALFPQAQEESFSRWFCCVAQGVQEGDLILKEDREEGQIGSKVYLYYARAYGCGLGSCCDDSFNWLSLSSRSDLRTIDLHTLLSAGFYRCACWSCAGAQSRASTSSPTGTAFHIDDGS